MEGERVQERPAGRKAADDGGDEDEDDSERDRGPAPQHPLQAESNRRPQDEPERAHHPHERAGQHAGTVNRHQPVEPGRGEPEKVRLRESHREPGDAHQAHDRESGTPIEPGDQALAHSRLGGVGGARVEDTGGDVGAHAHLSVTEKVLCIAWWPRPQYSKQRTR